MLGFVKDNLNSKQYVIGTHRQFNTQNNDFNFNY
jgi:hypothetical protein